MSLESRFTAIQSAAPHTVGIITERSVHFILPVSFFIVIRVVEQGQCISEKSITFTAVTGVQPLATNKLRVSARPVWSVSVPDAAYAIIISGITVSLAGKPKINATSITPSSPINLPIGSSADDIRESML